MHRSQLRTAALTAGISLAAMALISPLGLIFALPAGNLGLAALSVLVVAVLDVMVGVALLPILSPAGRLLAGCASGLRIAYGALFATGAGSLVGTPDVERFHAIWDLGLFMFGMHLLLVGAAMIRGDATPTWVGALVALAGAGYLIDAISVTIAPATPLALGQVTFVGEVVLLVWLIGWCGRRGTSGASGVAA